jgi:diadenylate cyclase
VIFVPEFFRILLSYVSIVRLTDIIDILIVTYLVYKTLVFIRDTKAAQLLKGVGILIFLLEASYFANLYAVNYILKNVVQLGMIAVLIVFQPELRRALEYVGRTSLGKWFNPGEEKALKEKVQLISEIVKSTEVMSKNKIGALIVIERSSKIGDIIGTGITLNSAISSELLVNIFVPKTPLHDGAVIIRENKIEAAACFLPLSQNPKLSKELGTRHRAGLGISEESDCVAVIVSEETGRVSVGIAGELTVGLSGDALSKLLTKHLRPIDEHKKRANISKRAREQNA